MMSHIVENYMVVEDPQEDSSVDQFQLVKPVEEAEEEDVKADKGIATGTTEQFPDLGKAVDFKEVKSSEDALKICKGGEIEKDMEVDEIKMDKEKKTIDADAENKEDDNEVKVERGKGKEWNLKEDKENNDKQEKKDVKQKEKDEKENKEKRKERAEREKNDVKEEKDKKERKDKDEGIEKKYKKEKEKEKKDKKDKKAKEKDGKIDVEKLQKKLQKLDVKLNKVLAKKEDYVRKLKEIKERGEEDVGTQMEPVKMKESGNPAELINNDNPQSAVQIFESKPEEMKLPSACNEKELSSIKSHEKDLEELYESHAGVEERKRE